MRLNKSILSIDDFPLSFKPTIEIAQSFNGEDKKYILVGLDINLLADNLNFVVFRLRGKGTKEFKTFKEAIEHYNSL